MVRFRYIRLIHFDCLRNKVKTQIISTAPSRRGLQLWLPLAARELTARRLRAVSVRCDDIVLTSGGSLSETSKHSGASTKIQEDHALATRRRLFYI